MENNRIENADLKRRLDFVLEEVDRLYRENMPEVGRELTAGREKYRSRAWHSPRCRMTPATEVASALATAMKNQEQVITTLENLLTQFFAMGIAAADSSGI